MPTRGVFQGNLNNTGSRVLEMLTSSKAVTASHAGEAKKLTAGTVGSNGVPVYFQNGIPVTASSAKAVIDWVTAYSQSIIDSGSSASGSALDLREIVEKTGSWEDAAEWVGEKSASLGALKGISFRTGSFTAKYYNPTASTAGEVTVSVPTQPGHVGAAPASHTHSRDQVTGLDIYTTTSSFNSYTASVSSSIGEYLPLGGGTLTGSLTTKDVTVQGNLYVSGSTVTVDTDNLNVKDKLILVASGSTTRAVANGAGIAVPTSSAGEGGAARIQYDGTNNVFTSSVGFKAVNGFTGSLQGTSSWAVSASEAVHAQTADTATSASEASHAISASHALQARNANSASIALQANNATSASHAISASEATHAISASYATGVKWGSVEGRPTFQSASFVTGAFTASTFNPTASSVQIKVPTTTTHISGLDAVTASVKQMVAKSASWDGVASTASTAYQNAVKALETASVAQREAESASYWKTEASKSAASASTSATYANAYQSRAAASASAAHRYALSASLSASNAAASASAASQSAAEAATFRGNASTYATQAQTYKNSAEQSASAASQSAHQATVYAVSASASNTTIQQLAANVKTYYDGAVTASNNASSSAGLASSSAATTIAARNAANAASASAKSYASDASASASLMYKNVGNNFQPVYMTEANGPVVSTVHMIETITDTRTSKTATLTGNSQDTELYDGKVIVFRTTAFATTGSKASLDLTLADGTTTGAKPVYLSGSVRLTTHYPGSSSLIMVYDANAVSASIQGAWRIHADRDANTTYGRNVSNVAFSGYTTASNIPVYNAAASGNAAQVIKDSKVSINDVVASGSLAQEAHTWITNNSSSVLNETASYAISASRAVSAKNADTASYNAEAAALRTIITNNSASWAQDNDTKVTEVGNHYKAANQISGSIGGATKVVTGFTLDAAGHVTAATTANSNSLKVTSASYANNATSASYANNSTTASYALIAEAVKDGAGLVVNTASFALDHYKPTTATGSAIGTTAARTYVKAINVDKNNHVISVTTGSETVTDTDRYVATASFASTGSNGANGVKMTLTRRGSDTGTVTATIPVASATTAGVVTGAQFKKWETGSNWVGANSASVTAVSTSAAALNSKSSSWDTAATNNHTHSNEDLLDSLTNTKTGSWDTAATNSHTHSNKAVLDGITAAKTSSWDAAKPGTVTSITVRSGSAYLSGNTTVSGSGTALLDLSAATKGKIESGSNAHTWITANSGNIGSHTGSYLPTAGGTVTGDLTVQGNAYFNGTASFINTTDLVVKDRLILLASGSANTASANGAGIAVQTASATTVAAAEGAAARIQYLSAGNKFTSSVRFEAPQISATGFTGSFNGKATSAGTADVATGLGVAGNTSASVAAAINAKWTYNENTIKAVKVNSASQADNAASATSASHVPFVTFVQTNDVYLTASVGNVTQIAAINSASRAISASRADSAATATTATRFLAASGSTRQPIYLSASGVPKACTGYTVTAAQTASWNASGALAKTAIQPSATSSWAEAATIVEASASIWSAKGSGNGTVTSIATGTGLAGGPITTTGTMSIAAETLGKIESGSTAFGWGNHASAGYVKSSDITTAVNDLVTKSGSAWKTDNDRYVATASFASTGSNGANGVKMTLTRRGSDTGTVVATIPVASTTAAGVMTGARVTALNNLTGLTASLIASGALAKTAIQPAATSSWAAATTLVNASASAWSGKQDAISDIATIRNNAASGNVAYGWGNHANAGYAAAADITSAINALVTTSGSAWKTDNDRYVATASFASTGSAGANGVKMTLTRRGSDTGTVVATIPVASATAAGVMTGTQYKSFNSGATWVGANSASFTRVVASASSATTALNWITNNSSSALSTTASCLGVAANTSASVAAAINAKWTYNENTIKAVKVNSASRADSAASADSATKLVGTSGSLGLPVYIDAGVPKECQGNIVSLPLSASGATSGTITLQPGKVYDCGTLTGNLTINLESSDTKSHKAIYGCTFTLTSAVQISFPVGILVMDGSSDIEPGYYYEITFMNNVAVITRAPLD